MKSFYRHAIQCRRCFELTKLARQEPLDGLDRSIFGCLDVLPWPQRVTYSPRSSVWTTRLVIVPVSKASPAWLAIRRGGRGISSRGPGGSQSRAHIACRLGHHPHNHRGHGSSVARRDRDAPHDSKIENKRGPLREHRPRLLANCGLKQTRRKTTGPLLTEGTKGRRQIKCDLPPFSAGVLTSQGLTHVGHRHRPPTRGTVTLLRFWGWAQPELRGPLAMR